MVKTVKAMGKYMRALGGTGKGEWSVGCEFGVFDQSRGCEQPIYVALVLIIRCKYQLCGSTK